MMDPSEVNLEFGINVGRRASIHVPTSHATQDGHRSHMQRLATFLDRPTLKNNDKAKKNHANELEKSPFDAFRRVKTFYESQHTYDLPMQEFYRQRSTVTSSPASSRDGVKPVVGGSAITVECAVTLRKVVFGTCVHCFPREWREACFTFQNIDSDLPYGLHIRRDCAAGLLVCVQAMLLRRLVYKNDGRPDLFNKNPLRPSHKDRRAALLWTLCHVLWTAGDKQACVVCLPQDKPCFTAPPQIKYQRDNITEMLHLFEFRNYDDLEAFVKRFLNYFEFDTSHGAILFLYSLVLSRTFTKLYHDYGSEDVQLLVNSDECSQALMNLALTGRAVRYLHNGKVVYSLDGEVLVKPKLGISERSEVGFLYWNKKEDQKSRTQVGSMLKTPKYPIWVTCVNGYYGVLFSLNIELVSHWRSEHLFTLHYYTGMPGVLRDIAIHVSTRVSRTFNARTERGRAEEEKKIPSMDQCIMTKWFGANTDWQGITPFV